jgi:hypothetical protein
MTARLWSSFSIEKINGELFEYWVEPTMDVFCGYTADDLSAKMMLLLFGNYLGTEAVHLQGGLGFLPEALASHLDVADQAPASRASPCSRRPRRAGPRTSRRARIASLDADVVVVAVPGDTVLGLFDEPRPAWQDFFPHGALHARGHRLPPDRSTTTRPWIGAGSCSRAKSRGSSQHWAGAQARRRVLGHERPEGASVRPGR